MKPILFNTQEVQAILDGRKTMTRRVIKPRYKDDEGGFVVCTNKGTGERWVEKCDEDEGSFDSPRYVNPPCYAGDILYVRETWQCFNPYSDKEYVYKATNDCSDVIDMVWQPSVHMPKEAARIFLRVTDVRVERVQTITAQDIRNEGLTSMCVHVGDMQIARQEFALLWNSVNKKRGYGWDANPWVWVIEFERTSSNGTIG